MMHPGKGEIADFLAGRLDADSRNRVVRHLFGEGCLRCQQMFKRLVEPLLGEEPWTAAEPVAEDQYDEALARARAAARPLAARWRKETAKLERALALLEQVPEGLGDPRFPNRQAQALHGWPLCEALLRKSYELRFSDPKRMLTLAEHAAGVAKHIRLEKYPWPGFVADLRAQAFANLGNAYRINDRLAEADAALTQAREFLGEGTGDPLLQARVLDLEASVRRAQRRLDDAISLLDRVHSFYLEAGDSHLAGRALISKGISTHYQGNPQEAVFVLERGLELIEAERDNQIRDSAVLSLAYSLADCGEYNRASRLLLQSGLREAFSSEPLNLLKLRWVEGKVLAGLGRSERAEDAFSEVRQGFVQRGQAYDAALVGLDLAAVWLKKGRAAQVRELAEEMYATLEDLGVHTEAARALYFVREACRCEAVSVSMIERVRTFLERLPWQAGLRFEPAMFAP